jgi:hypothetical protein
MLGSLLVLNAFVAMLGVHSGMTYPNSRSAVGVSIGTLLFLLLGVAVCMRMMVAFQANFENQLLSFAAFMLGGGAGLFLPWDGGIRRLRFGGRRCSRHSPRFTSSRRSCS